MGEASRAGHHIAVIGGELAGAAIAWALAGPGQCVGKLPAGFDDFSARRFDVPATA